MHQGETSFEELPQEEQVKTEIYAKDESGRSFAPSWYTINFKGAWQPSKFLQLTAGVENITDQRYRPYSSGISGAGINFIAGIRLSF
jgi:hemoglobin/transferrin/lactoferrin receptor protein